MSDSAHALSGTVNAETWSIVAETWSDGLPELAAFTTPITGRYYAHRFLLISWFVSDSAYAGAYQSLDSLTEDFDSDTGVPMFAVDLSQPPATALLPLTVKVTAQHPAEDLAAYYGE